MNSSVIVNALSCFVLIAFAACDKPNRRRGDSADAPNAKSVQAQGARVPDAESRMAQFLEGSLETSPPVETNAMMSCVPDGQTDRYLTLAKYRVLGSTLRGDTADVAAQIVSVAEETGHPHRANGYLTKVRIRTDTLHWAMTRDSSTHKWGVCGYSKEGYGFDHYGTDSQTEWIPPKQSWARVHRLADSVHAQP